MGASASYVPEWARGGPDAEEEEEDDGKEGVSVREAPGGGPRDAGRGRARVPAAAGRGRGDASKPSGEDVGEGWWTVAGDPDWDEKVRLPCDARKAYSKCLNALFRAYVLASTVSMSPECKAIVEEHETTLSLYLLPVLRMSRLRSTEGRGGGRGKSRLRVDSLCYETLNGHSLFTATATEREAAAAAAASRRTPSPEGAGDGRIPSRTVGESVYVCPTLVETTHVLTHLPFPLTLRLSNVLFTKDEIDAAATRGASPVEETFAAWRELHPPSSGALRSPRYELWVGDVLSNKDHGTHLRESVPAPSVFCDPTAREDGTSPPRGGGEGAGACRGARLLSVNHRCLIGHSYETDAIQHLNMQVEVMEDRLPRPSGAGGSRGGAKASLRRRSAFGGRDMLVCVPANRGGLSPEPHGVPPAAGRLSLGNEVPLEGRVSYFGRVSPDVVRSTHRTPYEYLSNRLTPPDPSVLRESISARRLGDRHGTAIRASAMRIVEAFMGEHEFYFETDAMVELCNDKVRKAARPATAGRRHPVAVRVGTYRKGALYLDMFENIEQLCLGDDDGDGESPPTSVSPPEKPKGGGKRRGETPLVRREDGTAVFAISKSACDEMRAQVHEAVHGGMLFSDFTNPKITVSSDASLTRDYLDTVEKQLNAALDNPGGDDRGGDGGEEEEEEDTEGEGEGLWEPVSESIQPVVVLMSMKYLSIRYPETLI
jgi:hypothetical protein